MSDAVCLDKTYIFMLMLALIFVGLYQYKKIGEIQTSELSCSKLLKIKECPVKECPVKECPVKECPANTCPEHKCDCKKDKVDNTEKSAKPTINHDPVREYDYKKSYDPLEDPTRRVERHFLPPVHVKNYIDIPTRGYPDNFHQVGTLISESGSDVDNKVLRLFGRQEFPGSNKYEYYTAINSGHDQVKVPLDTTRGQELYDDDVVVISELGSNFIVKLHKYDAPKYYPNINW